VPQLGLGAWRDPVAGNLSGTGARVVSGSARSDVAPAGLALLGFAARFLLGVSRLLS
jgi:hypothetical protein